MAVGDKRNTPEAPDKPDKLAGKQEEARVKEPAACMARDGLRLSPGPADNFPHNV
jgi:hypothetical protein